MEYSTYTVYYLEPNANERDFMFYKVKHLTTKEINYKGSFICVENYASKNYIQANRILQIEHYPNPIERQALIKKYRNAKKGVVYYHKLDIEPESHQIRKITNVGENPFGLECYILEVNSEWVTVAIPSWKVFITIPAYKVIGMKEDGGRNE